MEKYQGLKEWLEPVAAGAFFSRGGYTKIQANMYSSVSQASPGGPLVLHVLDLSLLQNS